MKDKVRIAAPEEEETLDLEDVELPPFSMSMGKLLILEACQKIKEKQEMVDLSGFTKQHVTQNVVPQFLEHGLIRETSVGYQITAKGFKVKRKVMQYRDYELTFVEEEKNKHYEDYVG